MNQNQLNALSDQQRARFAALEQAFASDGWKLISEWLTQSAQEQIERQLAATSWEQNRVARGAQLAFQSVAELPTVTEAEFAALADEALARGYDEDELTHE